MKIDYNLIDHIIMDWAALPKVTRIGLKFKRFFWHSWKQKQYCHKCGQSFHGCPEQMDLHHIDPDKKEYLLGQLTFGVSTIAKIYPELRKCICLCANCHRTWHRNPLDI